MNVVRYAHTASTLANGKILVAGGSFFTKNSGGYLNSAELYDPSTGLWTVTDNMTATRAYHTASILVNGKVLVAGGFGYYGDSTTSLHSAEIYDPSTGHWTVTGNMTTERYYHTSSILANGKVLVAGGADAHYLINSTELYA